MNNPIHRQRIMKCGWLRKQGGMVKTSWHRRWFCLNGDCLFYFAKEDDLRPQGSIFLPGNRVTEIQWTPDDSDKYLFEICPGKTLSRQAPNQEVFLLCANNNDERQGWIKAIRKVIYSDLGGAIFGQSIEETMVYEHRWNRKIPYIIEQSVEFLTEYGLEVEGIFRLPGRATLVKELKDRFDCAEKIVFDISEHDVHSVASLLKMYFRELPESIIPSSYYQLLMNVAMNFQDSKDATKKKEAVADATKAMANIPDDNYNIVRYLCQFLFKVGEKSDINKMNILNLATVFGPNIIRNVMEADSPELMMATADLTQQLAFMLINNYDEIFTEKKEEQKVEVARPEVPVDDLLDLSDPSEALDLLNPLPLPRVSTRNNSPGTRTSSLLTSVTEELKKRVDNNILQPITLNDNNSSQESVIKKDLLNLDMENESSKTDNNIKALDVRQRPIPPARKKKKEHNGGELSTGASTLTRSDSNDSTEVINDLKAEVENLKLELVNTREQYEKQIQQLKSSYNSKISVLRTNSENSERIYKERIQSITQSFSGQIEELNKELEKEKEDRTVAVGKVMKLQTELNRYHLQYGQLQ